MPSYVGLCGTLERWEEPGIYVFGKYLCSPHASHSARCKVTNTNGPLELSQKPRHEAPSQGSFSVPRSTVAVQMPEQTLEDRNGRCGKGGELHNICKSLSTFPVLRLALDKYGMRSQRSHIPTRSCVEDQSFPWGRTWGWCPQRRVCERKLQENRPCGSFRCFFHTQG